MTKLFLGNQTPEGGFTGSFIQPDQNPIPVKMDRKTWLAVQHFMIMENQPYEILEPQQGEQP